MVTEDGTKPEGDAKLTQKVEGTPEAEVKVETFTQEQVEKIRRDERSAALADVGRMRAESERAVKAAQSAQQRIDKLLKEQADAELEAARDDPDRLTLVQERQKRRQIESELDTARQQLSEKEEKAKLLEQMQAEAIKNQKAGEISAQYKIEPQTLLKFTDGSPEKMEELAKLLTKTEKKSLKTDSGRMVGGKLSFEELREQYIKDPRNPNAAQFLQMRAERRK